MSLLKPAEVARRLKTLPGWSRKGRSIRRTFEFEGFPAAITFVNRVARAAERADHHPDIDVRWNKVTLVLSTHSKGGLTDLDFAMAGSCSRILSGLKVR